MSKKEIFITEITEFLENKDIELSQDALDYLEQLKSKKVSTEGMTENGKKVLKYMQECYEQVDNKFKASQIGEGIFVSGRSVSGSMRKLIADGYVEKVATNPVAYGITELGKGYTFDN